VGLNDPPEHAVVLSVDEKRNPSARPDQPGLPVKRGRPMKAQISSPKWSKVEGNTKWPIRLYPSGDEKRGSPQLF
jgi:hypothetical protein